MIKILILRKPYSPTSLVFMTVARIIFGLYISIIGTRQRVCAILLLIYMWMGSLFCRTLCSEREHCMRHAAEGLEWLFSVARYWIFNQIKLIQAG